MPVIRNVSDTARWVAVYRAMETARPDALFKDPYAERLAGARGVEIMNSMKRGRAAAWAMITRTAVMDEMILDRSNNHGVDTVMNLAAGLDTRAWRLPLPASLQWFDVDLPEMSEYKASHMKGETPHCRYEAIPADLTDEGVRDDVFRKIGGVSSKLLIITEGLLIYLGEENVTSLAKALHAIPSARWWITDIANPMLLELVKNSWQKDLDEGNAPFKFAPEDSAAWFAPLGWKELVYRPMMNEARRLNREMPLMWFWRAIGYLMPKARRQRMKKMSGTILLERV
jgi:methyltransferase (TIGR00027 family)